MGRYALRCSVLGYLTLLLLVPVGMVFYRAFEHGPAPVWHTLADGDFRHALWLSVLITLIVVPLNTAFGVIAALTIVRTKLPGKGLVNAFVDLPLALSPVVVGVGFLLIYNTRTGWLGPWLDAHGVRIVYALPSMVLVTAFVSLPFVAREVVPVLREIGTEQEQAGSTLGASSFQILRRITLPAIRWGIAYGVVLTTARSLGEYGAVAVVSGKLEGRTETLTLHVEKSYLDFDLVGAYTTSVVLAALAVATLLLMNLLRPREGR
jgi:sulfate transport system permease protein